MIKPIHLIALLAIVVLFCHCRNRMSSASTPNQDSPQTARVKETILTDNKYNDLRNIAFSVSADTLHLNLPADHTAVYGTIMDWDYEGVTVTVVAFETGDASLYLSSGQIFIGGHAHERIKKAAIDLVSGSQPYVSQTNKTSSTAGPDHDCVKFYFLTNHGTFVHQETVANVTQPANEWAQLFAKAQIVIAEYRQISQGK